MKRSSLRILEEVPAALYLLCMYIFFLLPVVSLILFSFQDGNVPAPPFQGPTLRWYVVTLANHRLTDAFQNSILVAVFSSLFATMLGFAAAYGMARYTLKFKKVFNFLLMAPLSVSYLIIALGLLIMLNALGISRSLITIAIGHVVVNLPLCFGIILSQLGEHQRTMENAARDLGAKEWQVLFFVTIPLVAPAIAAAFALSMTLSWDEFIIALLLSQFDVTLPVEIWGMLRSGLNPQTNVAGTLVFLVSLIFVLIAEFLMRRQKKPVSF